MLRRCLICVLLIVPLTATAADPILMLLLRMLRDQAISASIERGVDALRPDPAPPASLRGYALPTPAVPPGTEEQRLRVLIDESFLHLTASQRDAVFAGMQKILSDPQYARIKPQIVAEFTVKAVRVRESYQALDRLSQAEKRALAVQARQEFSRMAADDRRQMLDALQAGVVPVPRDLSAYMLAELSSVPFATIGER